MRLGRHDPEQEAALREKRLLERQLKVVVDKPQPQEQPAPKKRWGSRARIG